MFAQRRLARNTAGRTRRYLTRNVADSWPLASASCGSPEGIPLGYAQPGRTLERLDPFDAEHENHMLIVSGRSGGGKTMTVNVLLVRALARGLRVAVIDRAGHYQFLTSLIPGAVQVRLDGRGNREAVCPWDVPDPARVQQGKVDYLLALHGLLLGRRDGSGLGDLEENLLGLAIREVYARCALTGEQVRELILQEELYKREASELRAGASDVAAVLRNLALRLNNYVGEGPYAYLADWPTTVADSARMLSFDTRAIPDSRAGAALFAIVEHVTSRIERSREAALATGTAESGWQDRHALVIDEAWKLVEQESTGRWFNELSRRSRHLGVVADRDQPLAVGLRERVRTGAASQRLDAVVAAAGRGSSGVSRFGLSEEELAAVAALRTVKREYATAFLCNGSRGSGTVSIRVSEASIGSLRPIR